jgi:hypothetical protein
MNRVAIIIFVLSASVCAVAQTQAPPVAPVSGSLQQEPTAEPTYEPSDRPLSGIQNQDIGISSASRNTLIPSITVSSGWDSNAPKFTGGSEQSSGISTFSAGLALNHETHSSLTSLDYLGGGQIYTIDSALDSQFHRLDFAQRMIAGRWTFLAADGLTYQKDAFASSPAFIFPGLPTGPGGTDFHPGVTPGESIIGLDIPRLNNSASGQVTYGFSRKTTLTTNFSYGLLHAFDDADFLNNKQWSTGAGVDHRFGRDTLGVNYMFTRFSYDTVNQSFDSHAIQVIYSHVLTGRWSFEAGGGPSIIKSNFFGFNNQKVYGNGKVSFRYKMRNSNLDLRYSRSVTNGSGVLPGSITDEVGVALGRSLTRSTSVNVTGGYARNSGAFVDSRFNTINVGAGVTRTVGRYASLSLGYTGQRQTGTGFAGLTRHSVLVSLNWNFRPVVLH